LRLAEARRVVLRSHGFFELRETRPHVEGQMNHLDDHAPELAHAP
jgi:hypothetical protein